jgi:hypothetical protein
VVLGGLILGRLWVKPIAGACLWLPCGYGWVGHDRFYSRHCHQGFFVDLCLCGELLALTECKPFVVFEGNLCWMAVSAGWAPDGQPWSRLGWGDCGLGRPIGAHLSCRYFNRQNYLCSD